MSFYPNEMVARFLPAAADVPRLLESGAATFEEGRACLERNRAMRSHGRYDDDYDLTFARSGHSHGLADEHRAWSSPLQRPALPSPRKNPALPPPLENSCDDLYTLEHRQRGRLYDTPPPYDATGEEPVFGRRGRRPNRDPPRYDTPDAGLEFDWPECSYSRHGLPPYDVADEELGFDRRGRRPIRDASLYRTVDDAFIFDHERHGHLHGHRFGNDWLPYQSRDMDADHLSGLGPRARRGMEAGPNEYHNSFEIAPRHGHYEANRRLCTGNYSDTDFPSVYDDAEDRLPRCLRAPRAAEMNDRIIPLRMDDKTDAKNQERERRKAHAETRYTGEDFSVEHPRRERRHRRHHRSRAARSRTAASPVDGDHEDFICGRQDIPLQPRHSRDRRHSRHGKGVNFIAREGLKHPSNDPMTRVQLTDQARLSNRRPVAATIADKTAEGATEKIIPLQQHAQDPVAHTRNKKAARDGGGAISHPQESITAPLPGREAREAPVDIAHPSRAGVHDNSHSRSSDSGYDTPDDDSEVSRTGDDDVADDGDAPELSIHIKR